VSAVKQPGDSIALGDILGHPLEPDERWARVIGIRKDDCRPIESVIIRLFVDRHERFPSGGYRTTWLAVPWEGAR
jgi:hypothetical protein